MIHLARGRPGGRFHEGSGVDQQIARLGIAWPGVAECAGVLSGSLATCPNMALRPVIINPVGHRCKTGANPVQWEIIPLFSIVCFLIRHTRDAVLTCAQKLT